MTSECKQASELPVWRRQQRKARGWPTVIGLLVTLALHGGIIATVLLHRAHSKAAAPPPPSYVVAKLVRLGTPKDKRRLPSKVVPPPPAAAPAPQPVNLTADAADKPKPKPKPVAPPKPAPKTPEVSPRERLTRALERAATLAEAERAIEQEGQPDGVVGGTAESAEDGDAYMTRLADIWNRTWSLPAIIRRQEAEQLHVLVVIHIDQRGQIKFPIQFDRKSGNVHFDTSIEEAWQRIKQIPLPPPDRLASILANGLPLKLNWKGMG